MPTNNHADIRYRVLDRCFSDFGREYTFEDLLEEVNEALRSQGKNKKGEYPTVNVRQLRKDIQYMESEEGYFVNIKRLPWEGKKKIYRYASKSESIYNQELSPSDLSKLQETIKILQRYKGLSNNTWLDETINHLERRFGIKPIADNIVSFEHNEKYTGLKFLSELINYTTAQQPLEIEYQPYGAEKIISVFHPYHIKQYNNRWFLFGLEINESGNQIRNKALDRIVRFSPYQTRFIKNEFIDFSTCFNNIVGVTIPDDSIKEEEIILKFSESRFPYIKTKYIHRSQVILNSDECTISIRVRPNKELDHLLLAYGPDVEIIRPQWYRTYISKKIEENYKKYFSCADRMHK